MKYIVIEIFLILIFVFIVNNNIGNVDKTIKSDGIGYYDYLPSIFIYNDIARREFTINQNGGKYKRILGTRMYNDYKGYKVNKYPCGTALLELPFFSYTLVMNGLEHTENEGYQLSYHKAVYYAALFYLFLSIYFLRKLLLLFDIDSYIILFCQLCLLLGTPVTNYANFDAGFSHIYSLFAIISFLYFSKKYFIHKTGRDFIIASVLFGLIFILRQPNIIIILFLPFLAGSKDNLISTVNILLSEKRNVDISFLPFIKHSSLRFELRSTLLIGVLLFLMVSSIQLTLWYLQTGDFFVYSYQGESFNFLDAQLINILFSYRKGLYIYTPLLFVASLSIIWFAVKKDYYLLLSWCAFFFILTYVLSSWWCWYYGASYGLRAYIDFYPIFFIPFAVFLNNTNKPIRLSVIAFSLLSIPLNIIQTYQYKEGILHYNDMDKVKYWKVFLNTDDTFKHLVFKKLYNMNDYKNEKEYSIGDVEMEAAIIKRVFSIHRDSIPNFENVSIVQVLIDDNYYVDDKSEVILTIDSVGRNYFKYNLPLIHFHEKSFGEMQLGFYNFEYNNIIVPQNIFISLHLDSRDSRKKFKNIRIRFLSKRSI